MTTAVWRTEWINDYESPWSIFEKFSFANVTEKTVILKTNLGTDKVRAVKAGVVGEKHRNYYTLEGFERNRLSNELLFDLHQHKKKSIKKLTDKLSINERYFNPIDFFRENLFWCKECMKTGYHSILHQFKLLHHCPFHMISLLDKCPSCNEDIPFLLQDVGAPYACKCGYILADLSHKWAFWNKTNTTIQCPVTQRWLELGVEELKEKNIVFDPEYAFRNRNALKLMVHAIDESFNIESEKGRVTKTSCPSMEKKTWSFRPFPVPQATTVNCNGYNFHLLHKGYEFSPVYEDAYQHTYEIFKSIDHHIKKMTLRGHENCLTRFVDFLKVEKDEFPPICPHAYAYIYWKQSLLGYEDFDRKRMAPSKLTSELEKIKIIAGPFEEDLKFYLYKVLEQSYNFCLEKPWQLTWLLSKIVSQYYIHFFKVLQQIAQIGAKMKVAPNRETVISLMYSHMPFLVIRHPVNFQSEMSVDLFMISNNPIRNDPNLQCPYRSGSMKKIAPNERRSSPLSYAMRHYSKGTRDEKEEKYIDEYYRDLKFRMY